MHGGTVLSTTWLDRQLCWVLLDDKRGRSFVLPLIVFVKAAVYLIPFELLLNILVCSVDLESTEDWLAAGSWLGHLHGLLFQLT